MVDRLQAIESRHKELLEMLSDPQVIRDQSRYRELRQENAYTAEVMGAYQAYRQIQADLEGAQELVEEAEGEMLDLAREEVEQLTRSKVERERELQQILVPPDPLDTRNTIVEIRAGTGGDEAALFASDLYRMYTHYAEHCKWSVEVMSSSPTGIGGLKEIVFSISGKRVYAALRYESGVHRVQRVPVTESSGRIHTSAVTVSVLPEAEETEIDVDPKDLRIDVYRSSGPGGQSVNTTDSAVRITHEPTGIVVSCQDEKSQHKNKAKALRVLKARLFEREEAKRQAERAEQKRSQIGSGDRSERIRTYNFRENRVTDHRIGLTLYRLEQILLGDLEEITDALRTRERERLLQAEQSTTA